MINFILQKVNDLLYSVKATLKKQHNIYYILKCIKNINNDDFVKYVLQNDVTIHFKYKSLGNLNKDKMIYIYEQPTEMGTAGFFAQYLYVLFSLFVVDKFGLIPVIKYKDENLYSVGEYKGTSNVYEYYFQQPSKISLNDAYNSYNVVFNNSSHPFFLEKVVCPHSHGYSSRKSKEYLIELAKIHTKYIRFNTQIEEMINEDINLLINSKKTLGIHVRGVELRNHRIADHPVPIKESQYIDYAKKAIDKYCFEKIFLATESIETINLFKNNFGNKLIYFEDICRTSVGDDTPPHFMNSQRKNHKYMLGIEVLRDAIALSKCDGLIAGLSNVSLFARINKLSSGSKYEYVKILDNGIIKSSYDGSDYVKKKLKQLK